MGSLRHLLLVLALLPAAVVVGCGDSGSGEATGGPQGGVEGDVAQAPPQLQIVRPEPGTSTDGENVSVEGIVTDDANVEVNGRAAEIEGPANEEGRSRWVAEVPLELGENEIEVVATLNGAETTGTVTVTRKKAKKETADKDSQGEGAPQGGPAGDTTGEAPATDQGNQGGAGGSQGGAGGSGGEEEGGQGGPAGGGGAGGNQGGSGGATGGEGDGGEGDGGDQGGPVGEPPPED